MIIVVNCSGIHKSKLYNFYYFINQIFGKILDKNNQTQVYFIFNQHIEIDFSFSKNIHQIFIPLQKRNIITEWLWNRFYFAKVLKKLQPNIIIHFNEKNIISSTIPQVLFKTNIETNRFQKQIKKSHQIIVFSHNSGIELIKNLQIPEQKIKQISIAANHLFKPINFNERQAVKDGYCESREYFLVKSSLISIDSFIILLKAFSLFKKWQNSNMKMVFESIKTIENSLLQMKLNLYKFKDDIIIINENSMEQVVKLTASAYCVISFNDINFYSPVLDSMKSEVPVIELNNSINYSKGNNNRLYANSTSVESIAEQMQNIYKDEKLRTELINNGLKFAQQFSWDKAADSVNNFISTS